MRIIRLKLKPQVSELLEELSARYSIEDSGFTEDLFSLFRFLGSGLPTDERLEILATAYSTEAKTMRGMTLMHMRKRRHVLSEMAKTSLFKSLAVDAIDQPHVAVQRLLQVFREFSRKRRQASCLSCSLRSKCDFGKQYGEVVSDARLVVDPDYKKKINPACPDLPQIEGINQLYDSMQKLQQINPTTAQGQAIAAITDGGEEFLEAVQKAAEAFAQDPAFANEYDGSGVEDDDREDQAENYTPDFTPQGAGKGGNSAPGTHSGKHFAKVNENFVNSLSAASLQLFEMGRKLDEMLKAEIGDKFKPTKEISARPKAKRIEESNEIPHVRTHEFAQPDDMFDAKLVQRDLSVMSHEKPETKKHLLYVLIDESGSMNAQICDGNSRSLLTRGQVACTLAGALCKRIGDDGGMMFLRFFSDRPGPMMSARRKAEFPVMLHDIVNTDVNGGGTSIITALKVAHQDITKSADEIAKAEILLITDMDDGFDETESAWIVKAFSKTAVGSVPLNVLNVNSRGGHYGNAHEVLPKIASKYLQVNSKSLDLEGIVELVK